MKNKAVSFLFALIFGSLVLLTFVAARGDGKSLLPKQGNSTHIETITTP